MGITEQLNKDNLHHAYLIEGAREEIVPEVKKFFESIDVKTSGNPDFCHITVDNFKIEEAFNLRGMSSFKNFSGKKIFLICANSFSPDAENVLLKMFEEPASNTHFFVVVPDSNTLLKTLVSRFYLISARKDLAEELKNAEKFIKMTLRERLDFIKELLTEVEEEDEEGNEIIASDSVRSKAIRFLNALETLLHNDFLKNSSGLLQPSAGTFSVQDFSKSPEHLLKVREFLRMPGSSVKNLMESVALITPIFKPNSS